MTHDDIILFCCEVAQMSLMDIKLMDKTENEQYLMGKYSVASYIRDNKKEYNLLQRIIIKVFKI